MPNYPILKREVEEKSSGSGPVIEYKLSPEELAKYRGEAPEKQKADAPAQSTKQKYTITKEFLEAELAAGKSIMQIEREQGMRPGTINYYVKKYGLESRFKKQKPADTGQQEKASEKTPESQPSESDSSPAVEETPDPICETQTDIINHPPHYTAGKVECIDAIESAVQGLEGIEAVCTANIIKYVWRWKRKGGAEDLRKAEWYLRRLIRLAGGEANDQGGN